MDTDVDKTIVFDKNGVCNYCKLNEKRNDQVKTNIENNKLEQTIHTIKNKTKNKTYNCIIGVSGGVDSTYVAYLVKKMGLNPLAVHFDNGWNSELAVKNIEQTLKTLNIDLYTYVINWKEFKDLQLSFLKASVTNAEIPSDHAIVSLLFHEAARRNIPYIIGGGNVATETLIPRSNHYDNRDWKHIKAIQKEFGTISLKTYPHMTLFDIFYCVLIKRIKYISILNYLEFDKNKAIETLKKEIGWQEYGYKHYESIYTRFFQGYILPLKFNFDKRKCHLSAMINSRQITRQEALTELEKPTYPSKELLDQDKEFVIKKLGLTPISFEKIMKSPIKQHADYPSNSWLFDNKTLEELIRKIAKKV